MLFNSPLFIFVFLPVAFVGFHLLRRWNWRAAIGLLTLASMLFYVAWNPLQAWPIFASIAGNFACGLALKHVRQGRWGGPVLAVGVGANLAALAYFKYAGFLAANVGMTMAEVALPLGISFFTFTQIAYLVDVRRGIASEADFLNYCLFVTFFPHLIAGPIIHHKEMMPQFQRPSERPLADDVAAGLALFAIGLMKKVVLADAVAGYASPIFAAAQGDPHLPFLAAWQGALAYTAQIYFDFSGYSDMAVGLARMFGINLPVNFNSPYQARNIIEFWRRWHITLSRFLRDYLYLPLGGNRLGRRRRYLNLAVVMLIGGLWHGANWTFVVWGGLHGLYLAINHLWRDWRGEQPASPLAQGLGWAITLLAVIVGWVFFRATDMTTALGMLGGMAGLNGFGGVGEDQLASLPGLGLALALLALAMVAPNSQQMVRDHAPGLHPVAAPARFAALVVRFNGAWAAVLALATLAAILNLWSPTEFLYYQF
ncbi:MAG: MBOAT family protein [Rhodospirillaceae bacterium]|nr:MBOAT family protein [Rhodospirillales bacterium]